MRHLLDEAKLGFVLEGQRRGLSQETIDAYYLRLISKADEIEKMAMEKQGVKRRQLAETVKSYLLSNQEG